MSDITTKFIDLNGFDDDNNQAPDEMAAKQEKFNEEIENVQIKMESMVFDFPITQFTNHQNSDV